jgi:hypothetical protein
MHGNFVLATERLLAGMQLERDRLLWRKEKSLLYGKKIIRAESSNRSNELAKKVILFN